MSAYRKAIYRWEHHLASRDPNRVVRSFDWGWEWIRQTPVDGLSPSPRGLDELRSWNDRVLAAGDRFFSYPAVHDYRLGPALRGGGSELTFTSPVPTPWIENQTVHARWFPARGSRRAVIVVPQWSSDAEGHIALAGGMSRFGISALRLSLPYHDVRMPRGLKRAEYAVDTNIGRTIHAGRQAVCDIRACVDWLQAEGFDRIGIIGTSLGSCYALLTSVHEPRLRVNVFNHVSGYFGDVVWTGISTRHVRQGLEAGIDRDGLREAWRVISPAYYLDRLAGADKKLLMIYARHDLSFLPELSEQVLAKMRQAGVRYDVRVLPCGHYTLGRFPFNILDGYMIVQYFRRWL
jgi:hypothetical protein